ncbi:hypothetical protein [Oryzihumus sp.]|uniref:hypothetical protein n=1 Tax=Oryzihumus sp. TaxID=1968903 RepID=UPI002ED92057
MPSPTRPLAGLAAVLLLSACGSATPPGGVGPSVTDGSALSQPLTLTRSGGVAGFRDRVVLAVDGQARVTSRGGTPTRCQVDGALMQSIGRAAAMVDWSSLPAPVTTPRHPDDLVVLVASGRSSARIEDPALTKLAEPLTRLLADVTAPVDQRRLCTIVPASSTTSTT